MWIISTRIAYDLAESKASEIIIFSETHLNSKKSDLRKIIFYGNSSKADKKKAHCRFISVNSPIIRKTVSFRKKSYSRRVVYISLKSKFRKIIFYGNFSFQCCFVQFWLPSPHILFNPDNMTCGRGAGAKVPGPLFSLNCSFQCCFVQF